MIRVNIHEAKANLSRYLRRVLRGETVVICNRNIPIAEIRPLKPEVRRRVLGVAAGRFEVSSSFFDPLPGEELDEFEGRT